jgi:hypothetical protein
VYNLTTGSFTLTLANSVSGGQTVAIPQSSTGFIPVISNATAGVITASSLSGVSSFNTRTGAVTLQASDVTGVGGALLASPAFTGVPTAPTASAGTSSTQLATTAFVATSFAPLASPALTGTPTAPTASVGTNNTQLASTSYVYTATQGSVTIGLSSSNVTLTAAQYSAPVIIFSGTLTANIVVSVPNTGEWWFVNATSGSFTVTINNGTGTQQTIPQAVNSFTPLISNAALGVLPLASGGVSSFNTRTGAVTLQASDVTGVGGALLASPAFTGSPTAPTQALGSTSTDIATLGYVSTATQGSVTVALTNANVTLTAAQYGSPVIVFTGTLTASVTITVPTTGEWDFLNLTTGSFTVTISNGTGATQTVSQSTTSFTPLVSNSTEGVMSLSVAAAGVSSFNTRTGAVTLQASDVTGVGGVLSSSPTIATPTITGRALIAVDAFAVEQVTTASTISLDLSLYGEFVVTISGATTINLINPPAANYGEVVIIRMTNGGSGTISWQAGGTSIVPNYAGGTAPTYTASGTDIIAVLVDYVGSTTTYNVIVIAQAVAT